MKHSKGYMQAIISRVTVCASIVVAIACCCLFFSLPVSAQTHGVQQGSGRIYGQLVNGTKQNAPLSGQQVTLQLAQGDNAQDLATATTDAKGNYSFPNLGTDKTMSYAVYTRYQEAQYVSDLISLDSKPVQQLNLTAYDATSSSANIAVVQRTLLISEPDPVRSTITISEVFFFRNLDTHTYVGSLDASKGKPNALLFSLPAKAKQISLGDGFNGYNVIQVDRGFASNAVVPPGSSQFSFSYQIPYTASTSDLSYDTVYPTVQTTVLVAPSIQLSSSVLTSNGVVTANQHPYRSYKSTALLPKQALQMHLSGLALPAAAGGTQGSITSNTTLLIVVLLLMLAIVLATWLVHRSYTQRARAKQKRKQVQTGKPALSSKHGKSNGQKKDSVQGKVEADVVDRVNAKGNGVTGQQKVLLQELLDLDKSYEQGKISKSVYQERRAKTKARLRSLMSEEEAHR